MEVENEYANANECVEVLHDVIKERLRTQICPKKTRQNLETLS